MGIYLQMQANSLYRCQRRIQIYILTLIIIIIISFILIFVSNITKN